VPTGHHRQSDISNENGRRYSGVPTCIGTPEEPRLALENPAGATAAFKANSRSSGSACQRPRSARSCWAAGFDPRRDGCRSLGGPSFAYRRWAPPFLGSCFAIGTASTPAPSSAGSGRSLMLAASIASIEPNPRECVWFSGNDTQSIGIGQSTDVYPDPWFGGLAGPQLARVTGSGADRSQREFPQPNLRLIDEVETAGYVRSFARYGHRGLRSAAGRLRAMPKIRGVQPALGVAAACRNRWSRSAEGNSRSRRHGGP
jgi:hypothetical protein